MSVIISNFLEKALQPKTKTGDFSLLEWQHFTSFSIISHPFSGASLWIRKLTLCPSQNQPTSHRHTDNIAIVWHCRCRFAVPVSILVVLASIVNKYCGRVLLLQYYISPERFRLFYFLPSTLDSLPLSWRESWVGGGSNGGMELVRRRGSQNVFYINEWISTFMWILKW